jgi:hypothetical protein
MQLPKWFGVSGKLKNNMVPHKLEDDYIRPQRETRVYLFIPASNDALPLTSLDPNIRRNALW